jgi:hypothetical protein
MTLPAAGQPISIAAIQTELQMSTSTAYTDRNYLDSLGTTTEGGIIAYGEQVSMSNFSGKTFVPWMLVTTVSFSDAGTYFTTPALNLTIPGGTDYRLHLVRQGKGTDRWFSITISRATGAACTGQVRRAHLVGITDVNAGDRSFETSSTSTYLGRPSRSTVWDYYFAYNDPAQVVAGTNYTFGIILVNMN